MQGIEKLENSISHIKSLKEFLSSKDLIDRYFIACQNYYGPHRFPRKPFDKILAQVRLILQKVPDFEQRLWNNFSESHDFSIEMEMASYGRKLCLPEWRKFYSQWFDNLKVGAKYWLEAAEVERSHFLKEYLKTLSKRFEIEATELKKLSGQKQRMRTALMFKAVRENQALQSLACFQIYKHFLNNEKCMLDFEDADLTLHCFRVLRQNPALLTKSLGLDSAAPLSALKSMIRERFPSTQELLKLTNIFPEIKLKTRRAAHITLGFSEQRTWEFKKCQRKFHGIFRGIPNRDCLGGNWKHLKNISPNRWAISLLEDVELYWVESSGRYCGFTLQIPIMHKDEMFYSCELEAPILKRQALLTSWLSQTLSKLPKRCSGLLMSEQSRINDPEMCKLFFSHSKTFHKVKVGLPIEMEIRDPLASQIIKCDLTSGFAKEYSRKGMIFEPTTAPEEYPLFAITSKEVEL